MWWPHFLFWIKKLQNSWGISDLNIHHKNATNILPLKRTEPSRSHDNMIMKCNRSNIYASFAAILVATSDPSSLSVLALEAVNLKNETNYVGVDPIGASASVSRCPEAQALETDLLLSNSRINELFDELKSAQVNISRHLFDLKAKELEVARYQKRLIDVNSALVDAISERNDSFQYTTSLQEKIHRMESECLRILNGTEAEIENLRRDLESRKRQAKSAEDRYQDTRKKMLDLEGELRQMHQKATSKYVNFTLIKSDALYHVGRIASITVRHAEKRWGRHYYSEISPRFERCKRAMENAIKVADMYVSKSVSRLYKTIVSMPLVETLLIKTSQIADRVYSQHRDGINEAVEAIRLSAVSAIEEFSKAAISLIDESAKEEEEKIKRRMRRKKDPIQHHAQMMGRRRYGSKFDIDEGDQFSVHDDHFQPSAFHLKSKSFFNNVLRNSKNLAENAFVLTPLILALLVTRNMIFGAILFLLGTPVSLIRLICFLKVLLRLSTRIINVNNDRGNEWRSIFGSGTRMQAQKWIEKILLDPLSHTFIWWCSFQDGMIQHLDVGICFPMADHILLCSLWYFLCLAHFMYSCLVVF